MVLKQVVIVPFQFWGGEGDFGGNDIESVVNGGNFLSGDTETQNAEDADWDKDSGDQDQSKSSESAKQDQDEEEVEEDAEGAEETDSSDDEEDQDEKTDDSKFKLPTKQAKEYPDNVMAHFAKRVGATLEQLKGNQPLRNAVKQLVDNAIFAEQQKAEAETETEDEQAEEEKETVAESAAEPTAEDFKAYDERLTKLVKQVNDPQMVDALVRARATSWGINPDDPKQMQALKDKGIDLHKQVEADSKAAINLFNTVAPMMMSHWLESSFPGFGKMYNNALQSQIWDGIREKTPDLPEYGTADFNGKIGEVLKQNPWIDQMVFTQTAKDGRKIPVSSEQQIAKKYELLPG
jgi:hypothetical protein